MDRTKAIEALHLMQKAAGILDELSCGDTAGMLWEAIDSFQETLNAWRISE